MIKAINKYLNFLIMKNLMNLGTILNKSEQKAINGGKLKEKEDELSCSHNILTSSTIGGLTFYGWTANPDCNVVAP